MVMKTVRFVGGYRATMYIWEYVVFWLERWVPHAKWRFSKENNVRFFDCDNGICLRVGPHPYDDRELEIILDAEKVYMLRLFRRVISDAIESWSHSLLHYRQFLLAQAAQ